MLFPERFNFNNNLFDDFFTDPVFNMTTTNRMSTDIKEKDNGYELAMEVPGFDKEDLKLDLEDGYLTVSAEHSKTNEEKDNEGHIIRQERYYGNTKRSFYVGEGVKQEDIKGEFKHGILKLVIPKKEEKPEVETSKYISIEG